MRGDRASLRAARMPGSSARRKRNPCRTAMPRGASKEIRHIVFHLTFGIRQA